MTSDTPIRVYLLDDHEVVRQGMRVLLTSVDDIEVVGESGSAVGATARIPALRPNVAVLDGQLPDGSGIEVCRAVRSVDPTINALILTSYDDDEALFSSGKSLIDPELTTTLLQRIRNGPSTASELDSLTEQELTLLKYIATGMTNRQIGLQMHLAEKTVKNYVSSILRKLGMQRRTQAAVLASRLLGSSGSGAG